MWFCFLLIQKAGRTGCSEADLEELWVARVASFGVGRMSEHIPRVAR